MKEPVDSTLEPEEVEVVVEERWVMVGFGER
jgi:hypothetical protein